MTRIEEIKSKASELANNWRIGNYNGETVEDILVRMAQWADEHPASPWISVEDRMPELELDVLTMTNKNEPILDHRTKRYEGEPYWWASEDEIAGWMDEEEYITHWMPIPKLPTP